MKNAKGFAGIELLLLLAVLLAVAGVGGYLYTRRAKPVSGTVATTVNKPSSTPADSKSTSPGGIPGGVTGAPTDALPSTTTDVKVTEVGFKITVPNSMKDLTYHVNGQSVTFSTAALTAAAPSCSASSGSGAFDTITRGDGTYHPPANPADGGLLKQYGDYYFAYTLPTGPCAHGLSVATQNLLDDQAQAFYSALSSVITL